MRYILLSPSITSVWESSTFPINFWNQDLCAPTSPSTSETVWQNHMQNPWKWSQRHHTQRCTKTSQTPNLQNVTQPMTIHDHPMMRMEKDSPRSATKQKRRTVQHLRKISCRCTSPRPRACRAWIQIANPKSMAKLVTLTVTVTTPMSIHPSSCFLAPFFPLVFSRYRQVFFQVFFEIQC